MIAKRRVHRDVVLAPGGGFLIPGFPVAGIGSVVGDVSADGGDGRMDGVGGLHEGLANWWIGRFGVAGIRNASISVGNETERNGDFSLEVNGLRLRKQLRSGEE